MNSVDIRGLITAEANAQGIPPEMALSVAQTESGISQWTPTGGIVTSNKGAQGVFQLMPATAAGMGVDPTDVNQNIRGGISYLKQLYTRYGNWNSALAAYNWGPGNFDKSTSLPSTVASYVSKILGLNSLFSSTSTATATTDANAAPTMLTAANLLGSLDNSATTWWALGIIAGAVAIAWVLVDD